MNYLYTKVNAPEKLIKELYASSVGSLLKNIVIQGALVEIETENPLAAADEATLLSVIQAHSSEIPDMEILVKNKIYRCMDFGKEVIAEFAAQNVVLGVSDAQMKQISIDFAEIQNLLLSGSLRIAKQEIDTLQSTLVTEGRRAYFSNKIAKFLAAL